jgi:hypothetical protein
VWGRSRLGLFEKAEIGPARFLVCGSGKVVFWDGSGGAVRPIDGAV